MSLKVNRGRTRARSQAMQILFQAEALDKPVEEVLEGDFLLSDDRSLEPYAEKLARGTYENLDRIDDALHAISTNWSLYRMPSADRNLLRIAVYEMRLLDEDPVDAPIVINEAVEVAKAYGTDESARFVNGVLGRIARMDTLPGEPAADEADEAGDGDADGAAEDAAVADAPVSEDASLEATDDDVSHV